VQWLSGDGHRESFSDDRQGGQSGQRHCQWHCRRGDGNVVDAGRSATARHTDQGSGDFVCSAGVCTHSQTGRCSVAKSIRSIDRDVVLTKMRCAASTPMLIIFDAVETCHSAHRVVHFHCLTCWPAPCFHFAAALQLRCKGVSAARAHWIIGISARLSTEWSVIQEGALGAPCTFQISLAWQSLFENDFLARGWGCHAGCSIMEVFAPGESFCIWRVCMEVCFASRGLT